MRFVSNSLIENLENRRLFSGSGHHDAVDVDPANHEANDVPGINEPVHHHRRTAPTASSHNRGHNDAVDNDPANHEANDAPGAHEHGHHQRGK